MESRDSITITLRRAETWLNFDPSDAFSFSDNLSTIPLKVEIKARECPWCHTSTEYVLVNGIIVIGGYQSLLQNNKSSDCCGSPDCQAKQKAWHESESSPLPVSGEAVSQSQPSALSPQPSPLP